MDKYANVVILGGYGDKVHFGEYADITYAEACEAFRHKVKFREKCSMRDVDIWKTWTTNGELLTGFGTPYRGPPRAA